MRCKVGDLVLVKGLHPEEYPENLGRFGTVMEHITCSCCRDCGDWWVRPQSTFVATEMDGTMSENGSEASFYDTSLFPIRPGDLALDTETTRELEHS